MPLFGGTDILMLLFILSHVEWGRNGEYLLGGKIITGQPLQLSSGSSQPSTDDIWAKYPEAIIKILNNGGGIHQLLRFISENMGEHLEHIDLEGSRSLQQKYQDFVKLNESMMDDLSALDSFRHLIINYKKGVSISVGLTDATCIEEVTPDGRIFRDPIRRRQQLASQADRIMMRYWYRLLNVEQLMNYLRTVTKVRPKDLERTRIRLAPTALPATVPASMDRGNMIQLLQWDRWGGLNSDVFDDKVLKALGVRVDDEDLQVRVISLDEVQKILKLREPVKKQIGAVGFVPNTPTNVIDMGGALNLAIFYKPAGFEELRRKLCQRYDEGRDLKVSLGVLSIGGAPRHLHNILTLALQEMYAPSPLHNVEAYKDKKPPFAYPLMYLIPGQFHPPIDTPGTLRSSGKLTSMINRNIFRDEMNGERDARAPEFSIVDTLLPLVLRRKNASK
jgi:hypothetical protein